MCIFPPLEEPQISKVVGVQWTDSLMDTVTTHGRWLAPRLDSMHMLAGARRYSSSVSPGRRALPQLFGQAKFGQRGNG